AEVSSPSGPESCSGAGAGSGSFESWRLCFGWINGLGGAEQIRGSPAALPPGADVRALGSENPPPNDGRLDRHGGRGARTGLQVDAETASRGGLCAGG